MKIIPFESMKEIAKNMTEVENIIDCSFIRFESNEGKVKLNKSVLDEDIYILADITKGRPDENYMNVLRIISAIDNKAKSINIIMPFLYESRQHKKVNLESNDCIMSLRLLESLNVDSIITIDCHDPRVSNCLNKVDFKNYYPTKEIINHLPKFKNPIVISPDLGAISRAIDYAKMLNTNYSVFYKRRNLTKVVNGKNPIIEHTYLGESLEGKDVIIVDDMISSGESLIDVLSMIKNASSVTLITTFALFTNGTKSFDEAYKKGLFDKLYTTNLNYNEVNSKWYEKIDMSNFLLECIK